MWTVLFLSVAMQPLLATISFCSCIFRCFPLYSFWQFITLLFFDDLSFHLPLEYAQRWIHCVFHCISHTRFHLSLLHAFESFRLCFLFSFSLFVTVIVFRCFILCTEYATFTTLQCLWYEYLLSIFVSPQEDPLQLPDHLVWRGCELVVIRFIPSLVCASIASVFATIATPFIHNTSLIFFNGWVSTREGHIWWHASLVIWAVFCVYCLCWGVVHACGSSSVVVCFCS